MLYFAFGSGTNVDQTLRRMPDAIPLDTGRVHGRELLFAGYSVSRRGGVATLRPKPRAVARGVIFDAPAADLDRMDRFEGAPDFYRRETIEVRLDGDDRPQEAVTYLLPSSERIAAPTIDYVSLIRRGFLAAGLPLALLDVAVGRTNTLAAAWSAAPPVESPLPPRAASRGDVDDFYRRSHAAREAGARWLFLPGPVVEEAIKLARVCRLQAADTFPYFAGTRGFAVRPDGRVAVPGFAYEIDAAAMAILDRAMASTSERVEILLRAAKGRDFLAYAYIDRAEGARRTA